MCCFSSEERGGSFTPSQGATGDSFQKKVLEGIEGELWSQEDAAGKGVGVTTEGGDTESPGKSWNIVNICQWRY